MQNQDKRNKRIFNNKRSTGKDIAKKNKSLDRYRNKKSSSMKASKVSSTKR